MIQIDIPMPRKCEDCPIYHRGEIDYFSGFCVFAEKLVPGNGIWEDCPLKEV